MKYLIRIFRDVLELYVPILAFVVMFSCFVLQVFFRYVLRNPLPWTQEIIVVAFVWIVMFGSCYTMRGRWHVKFTLVYDNLSPRMAATTRMIGNILIVATLACLLMPSYNYAIFQEFQKTAIVRIPYTVLFMPFVYFSASMIFYTLCEIAEDFRVLLGRQKA